MAQNQASSRRGRAAAADGARAPRRSPSAREHAANLALTLAHLMIWLSPAFPVGAYSYSHGLEWVIERGDVADASALRAWIEDVLTHGAGRSDAILLAAAWRAIAAADETALARTVELAAALAPSAERRLETLAQGTAFLRAVAAAWPHPVIATLAHSEVAYPVAVGAAAAAHGLPLPETAHMFAQAFAANLVSAGVRLIPLGQTDGVRVLAGLARLIPALVSEALGLGLEDVGGAALAADIASMRHETQYTRLFRS